MKDATQLEIDFVTWLGDLASSVPQKYGRYLETPDGNCDDGDYCVDCVDAEVAERKASGDPYTEIRGWDEAMEQDSVRHCERCGVMLRCSPTRYCIEQDIENLPRVKEMTPDEAAYLYNWLSGMGDYDRNKLWPQIKPHAKRLMRKANIEVVSDGFVTFRPADAILDRNWYNFDSIWLSVYQYFGQHLVKWMGQENDRYEVLCDTSGIHFTHFEEFSDRKQPHRCLRKLFLHVGAGTTHGRFLASLGFNTLADLERTIRIRDDRFDWPKFDVRGRILKGTPNKSHPRARTVTNCELQLNHDATRWCYSLFYDYTHHDRSSWCVSTSQKKGQSLRAFMESIPSWIDKVLEPEQDSRFRSHHIRSWDQTNAALERVFYFEECEADIHLTDALHHLDYGAVRIDGRISVDKRRMSTIKKWIAADLEKRAEELRTTGRRQQ